MIYVYDMANSIIESLKPNHSIILSKDEYYKLKEYVKRFCTSTSEYTEEDENRHIEQLYFICNRILYILTYIKYFAVKEEIYCLYRPL